MNDPVRPAAANDSTEYFSTFPIRAISVRVIRDSAIPDKIADTARRLTWQKEIFERNPDMKLSKLILSGAILKLCIRSKTSLHILTVSPYRKAYFIFDDRLLHFFK